MTAGAFGVRLRDGVLLLVLVLLWPWGIGALAFSPYASVALRATFACLFALLVPAACLWLHRRRGSGPAAAIGLLACALPLFAWSMLLQPSNERAWSPDQARLPRVQVDGDEVRIDGVRHFVYRSATDFDARWEQRRYDLARLESVWFLVEPFSSFPGAAHTFLSFGFEGGDYLAVSVEIRKEAGEAFSPWRGLYRNYELMYVLGDERDLVQLRTEQRRDTVYLYPLKASRERMRAMLLDVLGRAEALARAPEFYHSLLNNCATNIARHANRIHPGLVPYSWHLQLPGYADAKVLELGLIDFEGTLAQARERFRINERAHRAAGAADFSARIRAF